MSYTKKGDKDKNANLSIQQILRNEINEIKATEANAERAEQFQKKFEREKTDAEKLHVDPWDLPDSELWIDGIVPPSFVEFVEGKDFMKGVLFPRQKAAIINSVGNLAREVFYPRMPLKEYEEARILGKDMDKIRIIDTVVLLWGKGCLGKDTLLTNQRNGITKTVENWEKDGSSLLLYSWDGKSVVLRETSPIYRKGKDMLYDVSLNDGRVFRVTKDHRCLTPDGWKTIGEISSGDRVFSFSSNTDFPLIHQKNAQNERNKVLDFQADYSTFLSYDEPLHMDKDTAQSSFPSQDDVLSHTHCCLHEDDSGIKSEYIHSYRSSFHCSEEISLVDNRVGAFDTLSSLNYAESSLLRLNDATIIQQSFFPSHNQSLLNSNQCLSLNTSLSFPHFTMIKSICQVEEGDFYDLSVDETECYFDDQGILHHNSGKDFLIAYLIAWLVYVLNSMKDPWAYFEHEYGEPIEAINVARNADQAKEVFFNKLGNNLHKDCFKRFPFVEKTDSISFYRDVPGISTPVDWLKLYSRHSQSGSYEGHNVLFFVMDEASSFELKTAGLKNQTRVNDIGDDIVLSPADEIYNTLKTSAGTRFGVQWLGFIISFPRVEGDFTMRMHDLSKDKENHPYLWGDIGATWDINIRTSRSHFERDYRDDPETARLMLECIPPPARGGFFSIPERIDGSFSEEHEPAISYSETRTKSFDGQKFIAVSIDSMRLSPNHTYYAHFDPGLSGDSFAFALAHPNWLVQEQVTDPDGKEYAVPQIVVDAVIAWRPDKREKVSVDFLNVNEVIMKIAHGCHLAYCTADLWNSEHLKQSLQKAHVRVDFEGINTKEQIASYKNLKTVMYRGLLRICGDYRDDIAYPALARARDEMRRLMLVNGTKIDHPPGGSKDISDAIAGAVYLASQRGLGNAAFHDWNIQKKDDMLLLDSDKMLQREKKIFSAPTGVQISKIMRGIRY